MREQLSGAALALGSEMHALAVLAASNPPCCQRRSVSCPGRRPEPDLTSKQNIAKPNVWVHGHDAGGPDYLLLCAEKPKGLCMPGGHTHTRTHTDRDLEL